MKPIEEMNIFDVASILHEWTAEHTIIINMPDEKNYKVMGISVFGTTINLTDLEEI